MCRSRPRRDSTDTADAGGSVLLGTEWCAGAVGLTDTMTTHQTIDQPANIAPGNNTTGVSPACVYQTLQNTGNANDTYTLDAPVVPAASRLRSRPTAAEPGQMCPVAVPPRWSLASAVGKHPGARYGCPANSVSAFNPRQATSTVTPADTTERSIRLHRIYKLTKAFRRGNGTGVGGATIPFRER